jgi:hypothetical protein
MKAIRVALLTGTLLIGSAFPALAGAAPAQPNPSQYCTQNNNTVMIEVAPGIFFPLSIPSHGGCVSTVASGELSQAAYIANCKVLAREFPEVYNAPVDIRIVDGQAVNFGGFGGSLGSCSKVLRGYHTGTLTHPE